MKINYQAEVVREIEVMCFHCGQPCPDDLFRTEEKKFCCYGCKTVFEILNENDLCAYYNFDSAPGLRQTNRESNFFDYLDDSIIRKKVVEFEIEKLARVTFQVPAIHCISCIWLLENLNRLDEGIIKSEVNFVKKKVTIDFNPEETKLSSIAELLSSTGYEPVIRLETENKIKISASDLLIKLSVAGFCFGNIMLLSFPEYLGIDKGEEGLRRLFSYLNIGLSIPVLLYSGRDYLVAAIKSFRQRQINIDVPIAIGLLVLFSRSVFDILSQYGPGYLDSLSGLVFFLLIGRWFQSKTYESLAFDRDYRSYFPLAVYKKSENDWVLTIVHELTRGDHIRVRNNEIVPADSYLLNDDAIIDYSFVTGESKPVKIMGGELIYAGGLVIGKPAVMTVEKETSQSHLTGLWNNELFKKPKNSGYNSLMNQVAKLFTWSVLLLALATALTWYFIDFTRIWLVVTSVLIVACPCALALAAPFTYANMLRVFGNNGLYLKNAEVIEQMSMVDSVVFDKTGTITRGATGINWCGVLGREDFLKVKSLAESSTHPLSALIAKNIEGNLERKLDFYKEFVGLGIEGGVDSTLVQIGSAEFVGLPGSENSGSSKVFVSINEEVKGYFLIGTTLRTGINQLIDQLGNRVKALLSGDGETDRERMKSIFQNHTPLLFHQNPQNKLDYVSGLQRNGAKVMMLGDGLNDSGALKQSNVGIAVTDDTGLFTPACDGILAGNKLPHLKDFLDLSKSALLILKISLIFSLLYNVVGLTFAVTGYLTPLIAAVLMPISSISVVGFTSLAVNLVSKKKFS